MQSRKTLEVVQPLFKCASPGNLAGKRHFDVFGMTSCCRAQLSGSKPWEAELKDVKHKVGIRHLVGKSPIRANKTTTYKDKKKYREAKTFVLSIKCNY